MGVIGGGPGVSGHADNGHSTALGVKGPDEEWKIPQQQRREKSQHLQTPRQHQTHTGQSLDHYLIR